MSVQIFSSGIWTFNLKEYHNFKDFKGSVFCFSVRLVVKKETLRPSVPSNCGENNASGVSCPGT